MSNLIDHLPPNYTLSDRMVAEEIDFLRAERDEHARWRAYNADQLHDAEARVSSLRAALIAAMEIVQKERVRIAYNAKGAPPAIEIGYADILHRLDAIIAQADAALGIST